MGSSWRLWDTCCGWKDLPKSAGKQLRCRFLSGVPWEGRRRVLPLPARGTGRHPGCWFPSPVVGRHLAPANTSSMDSWIQKAQLCREVQPPSPTALDRGGSCWECVLINKEHLSNHCHVSILALLSNHKKMTRKRRLLVASGVWWEVDCNSHSLDRSHMQFKAPPRHTEMVKSKMFTN